jgi:hypothetical protein
MKKLGYLMIIAGFLLGALAAVVDAQSIRWPRFAAALVVGAAGIALVRVAQRQTSRSEGKLASDMQSVEATLSRIVENITQLNAQKHAVDTYDMHSRIDEIFTEDLARFVQARESIAHVHGLTAYADVMSCFAAGERYLNRVWSASVDGYIDEVNSYLDTAQDQFAESLDKVRQLKVRANTY